MWPNFKKIEEHPIGVSYVKKITELKQKEVVQRNYLFTVTRF